MAQCLCASDLRHRIELRSMTATRDAIGGLVEAWATYGAVKAQVRQATGRETWYRQQINAGGAWTIGIRWRGDVTTKHRVVFGGREFEIRAVTDEDQRRRYLLLACDEIVAP